MAVNQASVARNLTQGPDILLCCSSVKSIHKDGRLFERNGEIEPRKTVHCIQAFPFKLMLLFSVQVAVKIIDKTQLNSSSLQKVGPNSTFYSVPAANSLMSPVFFYIDKSIGAIRRAWRKIRQRHGCNNNRGRDG